MLNKQAKKHARAMSTGKKKKKSLVNEYSITEAETYFKDFEKVT